MKCDLSFGKLFFSVINVLTRTTPLVSWPCWMRSAGSPKPQMSPSLRSSQTHKATTPSSPNPNNWKRRRCSLCFTMLERYCKLLWCYANGLCSANCILMLWMSTLEQWFSNWGSPNIFWGSQNDLAALCINILGFDMLYSYQKWCFLHQGG